MKDEAKATPEEQLEELRAEREQIKLSFSLGSLKSYEAVKLLKENDRKQIEVRRKCR